jgi:ATP-dependent exoDNAse (exonuclease V) beta subunit
MQQQQQQQQQRQQQDNIALATLNGAPRDDQIVFTEYGHKYEILTDKKSKYTSVTTWVHSHFPKFNADEVIRGMMGGKNWTPDNKYWGLSPDQIKKDWNKNGADASKAGTKLHKRIENFMNIDEFVGTPSLNQRAMTQSSLITLHQQREQQQERYEPAKEWDYFMNFAREHSSLSPYRTEWMVYDEQLKFAGSIDMVYINGDESLSIYDWKRSKEITKTNGFGKSALTECIGYLPDSNFWHYALQLNTYKLILERNYGKRVKELKLVRLHPDAEHNNYEVLDVPIMSEEMDMLVEYRLASLKEASL